MLRQKAHSCVRVASADASTADANFPGWSAGWCYRGWGEYSIFHLMAALCIQTYTWWVPACWHLQASQVYFIGKAVKPKGWARSSAGQYRLHGSVVDIVAEEIKTHRKTGRESVRAAFAEPLA